MICSEETCGRKKRGLEAASHETDLAPRETLFPSFPAIGGVRVTAKGSVGPILTRVWLLLALRVFAFENLFSHRVFPVSAR